MTTTSARPDRLREWSELARTNAGSLEAAGQQAHRAAVQLRAGGSDAGAPSGPALAVALSADLTSLGLAVAEVARAFEAADRGPVPSPVAVADPVTLAARLWSHGRAGADEILLAPLRVRIDQARALGRRVAATRPIDRAAALGRAIDDLDALDRRPGGGSQDPALAAALIGELEASDLVGVVQDHGRDLRTGAAGDGTALVARLARLVATAGRTWDGPSPSPLDRSLVDELLAEPGGRTTLRTIVALGGGGLGSAFLAAVARGALVGRAGGSAVDAGHDEAIATLDAPHQVIGSGFDGDEALLAALADDPLVLVDLLGPTGADAAPVGTALVNAADSPAAQRALADALAAALALPELAPHRASTARTALVGAVIRAVSAQPDRLGPDLARLLGATVIDDPGPWATMAREPTSTADEATPADVPLGALARHHETLVALLAGLETQERLLLRAALRGGDSAQAAELALRDHTLVVAALERGAEVNDVPVEAWGAVFSVAAAVVPKATALLPGGPAVRLLAAPVAQAALSATRSSMHDEPGTSAAEVRDRRLARTRNVWLALAEDPNFGPLLNWEVPGSPLRSPADLSAVGSRADAGDVIEAWIAAQPVPLRVRADHLSG